MTNTKLEIEEDIVIINSILAGRTNEFAKLMDRYSKFIFTILKKIIRHNEDAEDVLQEVFVLAYRNLSLFKTDSSFKTWIYRIAYNKAISHFRTVKKYKANFYFNEFEDFDLEYVENKLNSIENLEKKQIIDEALDNLDDEEKAIILLYYFEDLKLEEIASIVNLSVSNIKIKLFRTRKKLYKIIEKALGSEIEDWK